MKKKNIMTPLLKMKDVNKIIKNYSKGITKTDEYELYGTSVCEACKEKTGIKTCNAYPGGIPDDIYEGKGWLKNSLCLKD
jgi:hypothetical protein